MTCCRCQATDEQFDARFAQHDLKRFQSRGPDASTRQLLAAIGEIPLPPEPVLLDVGGGVGAIHHVLLERGFARAVHVDASAAYLAVAEAEAGRRGHAGRVDFLHADFPEVAQSLPLADLVTLDRVVCCDPDFTRLLGAAADRARRLVAFSYPRPRFIVRLVMAAFNFTNRLRGRTFRAYVHPPAAMTAALERAGTHRRREGGTWFWAVEVFERTL
ncbi:MAG TPA: methyltransferase domain-containing protein [bacterium]|jgi:magnesium-protoporphyrin O-methyltransferase|nr:methyltransferase domain-containing protein [bacterium]HEV8702798.1 methyltransferase domain-containing protein [Candidatus Polarisedimenticolia bacterium]